MLQSGEGTVLLHRVDGFEHHMSMAESLSIPLTSLSRCHLSWGDEHLFMGKTPSLFLYFPYWYHCCYCAFLIPLLFAFRKSLSQSISLSPFFTRRVGRSGVAYLKQLMLNHHKHTAKFVGENQKKMFFLFCEGSIKNFTKIILRRKKWAQE